MLESRTQTIEVHLIYEDFFSKNCFLNAVLFDPNSSECRSCYAASFLCTSKAKGLLVVSQVQIFRKSRAGDRGAPLFFFLRFLSLGAQDLSQGKKTDLKNKGKKELLSYIPDEESHGLGKQGESCNRKKWPIIYFYPTIVG